MLLLNLNNIFYLKQVIQQWIKFVKKSNQKEIEQEKFQLIQELEKKKEQQRRLNQDCQNLIDEVKRQQKPKILSLIKHFELKQVQRSFLKYRDYNRRMKFAQTKLDILASITKTFYVKQIFIKLMQNSDAQQHKRESLGKLNILLQRNSYKMKKNSFKKLVELSEKRGRLQTIIERIQNTESQRSLYQSFQRLKQIPLKKKQLQHQLIQLFLIILFVRLKIIGNQINLNNQVISKLSEDRNELSNSLQESSLQEQTLLKRNCLRKKFLLFKFIKNQTSIKLNGVLNNWKQNAYQKKKITNQLEKLFIILQIYAERGGLNILRQKIHQEQKQELLKELNIVNSKNKNQQTAASAELGILNQKLIEKRDQTTKLNQKLTKYEKKSEQNLELQIKNHNNKRNHQIIKYIFSAWKSNSKMNVIALKIMNNIIKHQFLRASFFYLKDTYYQQKSQEKKERVLKGLVSKYLYTQNIQSAFYKWSKISYQVVEEELLQGLDLELQVKEKIRIQQENQLNAILKKIIQQRQRALLKNILMEWQQYKEKKQRIKNGISHLIRKRNQQLNSQILAFLFQKVQITKQLKKIKQNLTEKLQNDKLLTMTFNALKERHLNLKSLSTKMINLIQNRVKKVELRESFIKIQKFSQLRKQLIISERNNKLASIYINQRKKEQQIIQTYLSKWYYKNQLFQIQIKQFNSLFNHLEKKIKISAFTQFKGGVRKLKDLEKYSRFSKQAETKREITRNIACLMDFIKDERINPKEVEQFIQEKENLNSQRLQKCVTYFMLKCTSSNKNDPDENLLLPKAFNTWVSQYKYNQKMKKGLKILSKIMESRQMNLLFLIWKNKNKDFLEKIKKMTRPQIIQKMKYLYQYSQNMEDFLNENYGIIQGMQVSNQILSDGYKIGINICIRYLSRKIQDNLQKGFNKWKLLSNQYKIQQQDKLFDNKSQDIIRLKNHINIMKQKISLVQNENEELKANCFQGQELSKSLQKILQEREKFSIDLAEKSYTLQILIEDNKSLKYKLQSAQKSASQMMHEYQLQQALAESTLMSQNYSRIQE